MDLELRPRYRLTACKEILELMAGVRNLCQTHHPARALQGVQLSQQPCRRVLVIAVVRDQIEDPLEAVAGLVEKEREQFRVSQIFVQFSRFTSTPSVPTISPLEF